MTSTTEARIAPWLAVDDGAKALAFYKEALGAVEVERLEDGLTRTSQQPAARRGLTRRPPSS